MVCCTQAVKEKVSEDVHSGSCGALAVSLFDDLNILFACRLKAQQRAAIGRIHTHVVAEAWITRSNLWLEGRQQSSPCDRQSTEANKQTKPGSYLSTVLCNLWSGSSTAAGVVILPAVFTTSWWRIAKRKLKFSFSREKRNAMLPVHINKVHYTQRACFNNNKTSFLLFFFPSFLITELCFNSRPIFYWKTKGNSSGLTRQLCRPGGFKFTVFAESQPLPELLEHLHNEPLYRGGEMACSGLRWPQCSHHMNGTTFSDKNKSPRISAE